MDSTTFNHGSAVVQQEKRKRELFTLPVIPLKTTREGQKRVSTAVTMGAQSYPGHSIANAHSTTVTYWLRCNGNRPALRSCDKRISLPESHRVVDKTCGKGLSCPPKSLLVGILKGLLGCLSSVSFLNLLYPTCSLLSRNYLFKEGKERSFQARAKENLPLLQRLKVELRLMGLK